jgi:CIC family chloride channel protein
MASVIEITAFRRRFALPIRNAGVSIWQGPALARQRPLFMPAESTSGQSQVIYGQLQDFVATHERRRRQMPRALAVGIMAGIVAVAFRRSLTWIDDGRSHLIEKVHQWPGGVLVLMALFGLGSALAIYLVKRFAPETSGSGIPHVAAVLHRLHELNWRRVLPIKFFGGILAIGAGMALGREGPTIQMGAAVGQMASDMMGTRPRERRTLIAAGAAAGLAAAFNAPLAGLMFVLEELQRDFATGVFTAAFMAAVASDIVTRLLTSQAPVYAVPSSEVPALTALPAFVVLGLVCGVMGVAYNRGLLASLRFFERFNAWPKGAPGLLLGVLLGGVAWFWPEALGDGHHLVRSTIVDSWTPAALIAMFGLRFMLTMLCYGSGAPGGIFAPLLVLGTELGCLCGLAANLCVPNIGASPATFAIVAMAAYFTAIVRSPLTGIVLVVEMTANFNLLLALLAASLTAYAVADLMGDLPIYEALLQRQLHHSTEAPKMQDTLLVELPLQQAAPFEGKRIADLRLPTGCLLVAIRRAHEEIVPTAQTVLEAGDWVVAVVSPQATNALPLLRQGMGAEETHGQVATLPAAPV